jgi:threonine aldolase
MMIDLRSDTVTKPTEGMRRAIANAEVGDDVFREDPTARALEERVAGILGKEAALFVSSGTMGNQLAVATLTRPGDEVIIGEGAHVYFYESGAAAAVSGVQFAHAGSGGLFRGDDVRLAMKPRAYYCARTSLVCVENTHNRAGGRIFPHGWVDEIASACSQEGLPMHLDGARLWNASVATGQTPGELARHFVTVSVCFSKGLGAPAGSVLAGPRELIERAVRFRKMWGGGMRQVGMLAAGAAYALEHHLGLLERDHEHAALIAAGLQTLGTCAVTTPETNIVHVRFASPVAQRVASAAKALGVHVSIPDDDRIRMVTHLDVKKLDAEHARDVLVSVIDEVAR